MMFKNTLSLLALTAAMALPLGAQDGEPKIEPTGKAPSKAIVGFWAPNKDAFIKAIMATMPEEAKADAAALAAMQPMIEGMVGNMAFSFTDGSTEMIGPQGIEKTTWKVTSEDAKTGSLKVKITKEDGSTEDGEALVGKDQLIMIDAGEEMRILCDRITEAEFNKRKAAAGVDEALKEPAASE